MNGVSELDDSTAEILLNIHKSGGDRRRNTPDCNDLASSMSLDLSTSAKRNCTLSNSSPLKSNSVESEMVRENTTPKARMKKQVRRTLVNMSSASTPDRKSVIQHCGKSLKNVLKLNKVHRWCYNEWFYSNIDKALFDGDSEFVLCLKESFPGLKTRRLTRFQWGLLRRLMGRPRRCSATFFEEERNILKEKRQKIRSLQQKKVTDLEHVKDLPDEIPQLLVVGTHVTAFLRSPQRGLFTGRIEAVDAANARYRITFDRPGLGTHYIDDTEVLSEESVESMLKSSYVTKQRPRSASSLFSSVTPPRLLPNLNTGIAASSVQDSFLDESPRGIRLLNNKMQEKIGGFSHKFLELVVDMYKLLESKRKLVHRLKELNTQAEKINSQEQPMSLDFKQHYANVVLELEELNKTLTVTLEEVQQYSEQLDPECVGELAVTPTDNTHVTCKKDAAKILQELNAEADGCQLMKTDRLVDLITDLTSVLLHIKTLAETDFNSMEIKSLATTVEEVKSTINEDNISVFEDNVEAHVAYVKSGLSKLGNLHAFSNSN